jgi:hypothetical protein
MHFDEIRPGRDSVVAAKSEARAGATARLEAGKLADA